MHYDRIYELLQRRQLTDLKLKLKDNTKEIEMDLHKIILIAHSPYFYKLLTFGKEPDEVTLKVADAEITRDLILTFYGKKTSSNWCHELSRTKAYELATTKAYDYFGSKTMLEFSEEFTRDVVLAFYDQKSTIYWFYELAMTKARDYFGIETTIELPEKIDPVDYDIILEICAIAGFDEKTLGILTKNLPQDYDLKKLSKELVSKMIESGTMHILTSRESNGLKTWDIMTGELVQIIPQDKKINDIYFSVDGKFFATINNDNECHIRSVFDEKIIFVGKQIVTLTFSYNKIHCVMACEDGSINICHLLKRIFIWSSNRLHSHTNKITFMRISFSGLFIASGSDRMLNIWDVEKGQHLHTIVTTCGIKGINFSKDASIIAIVNTKDEQEAWKFQQQASIIFPIEILCISFITYKYVEMCDDVYAAVKNGNGINIVNLSNNQILAYYDNISSPKILFSSNNKYIALSKESSVELYRLETSQLLYSFQKKMGFFTFDNKYFVVAFGSYVQTFNLHDCTFHNHIGTEGSILSFRPTEYPDIMIYATHNNVKIYNMATHSIINTFKVFLRYANTLKIYSKNALRLLEIIE